MRTKLSTTAVTLAAAAAFGGPLAGTAGAAPPNPQAADASLRRQADRIMNLTYQEFARTRHVAPFDWTTDGCSVPAGLTRFDKVFRPACVQHDFGYRNYGSAHELKLSPTRKTKNWIDGRFRTEMQRLCDATYKSSPQHENCLKAKDTFYFAVNNFGDKAFF